MAMCEELGEKVDSRAFGDLLLCPCCGQYYFDYDDICVVCRGCGWHKNGANLDEYKAEWEKQLAAEPPLIYPCPVCGTPDQLSYERFYEICSVCGWEDDGLQYEEPDYENGANPMSLNRAKRM